MAEVRIRVKSHVAPRGWCWTTVPAEIVGPFAIHATPGDRTVAEAVLAPRYTVTHLLTGMALVDAVPQSQARACAQELSDLPVSWDFSRPRCPKKVSALARPICARYGRDV